MITTAQIPNVIGHTAYDRSHNKIGKVENVYLDNETGQPAWMTLNTGLFGTRETFVPAEPAELSGDEIIVPFNKEQIKDAPSVDTQAGGFLPEEEEARLYEYYGFDYPGATGTMAGETTMSGMTTSGMAGQQTVGGSTDDAMTRSEERMVVGKETREAGRARLRKYVITEEQTQTVPVRREEVRVEREPITDENRARAMSGPEITESEHEVILHEERPVVGTETVPVERVRLTADAKVDEETVAGTVRKERIETEGVPGEMER